MRKIIYCVLCCLLPLVLCACDTERNQIIRDLIMTPTFTPTPLPPTETPFPTPLPTATPTELPERALKGVDELIRIGDYDRATQLLDENYDSENPDENSSEILYDYALIASRSGRADECRMLLEDSALLDDPSDTLAAPIQYLYAQCSHDLENYNKEIYALQQYLELFPDTVLRADIFERMGDGYILLNDQELARLNFRRAVAEHPYGENDQLNLKIAQTNLVDGNDEEGVQLLTSIYENSRNDCTKAQIDFILGNHYRSKGNVEESVNSYQDAVNHYPTCYFSYASLLQLVDKNQPVSDYQRGLVDYYAGQYAMAAQAFHRYIKSEPGHDGSSWYFIGLCRMYLAEYDAAEEAYRTLIEKYPENRYYVSAVDELAYVQWMGQKRHKKAAETLLDYVKAHPDQADSAAFLFEAARVYERGKYVSDAAVQWGRLIDEYPLYEKSQEALFLSAVSYYRIRDYESAQASLNRLLTINADPSSQSRAHFWLAKVYEGKQDSYNRDKYFRLAAADAPMEYYGLRAQEILDGKAPLTLTHTYDFIFDLADEKVIADQWMMLTFNLSPESLEDATSFIHDPDYTSGIEYLSLGDYETARFRFDAVREKLADDPAASYVFMQRMVDYGFYYPASYTARQILTAAGLIENARTYDVPNYFSHIRYGLWYSEYVLDAAELYNVSPLLIFALIRQESSFDPWIWSGAGARGLMQIMPETGEEIAKTLHWPANYDVMDLTRVPVAVHFAASYLSRFDGYYAGDKFAMLSAYNAGAGNTAQWTALAEDDPDLFVEIIRFEETRNYIHNIYEFAKMYERLYGR